MIKAHLNGGPRDDVYITVPGRQLRIAGHVHSTLITNGMGVEVAAVPSIREGLYEARTNVFGDLVPHNLDEVAEFDWFGWV